jgi:sugar phosphate isomerase/epimerase
MQISQVGAQLYTVRDFMKVPADMAASLKKLREIGYQAVQVSAVGPIPEEELVKMCQGEGITICATHEPTATILDEPMKVVERLHKLGCKYTAVPSPGGLDTSSVDSIRAYAHRMNEAGRVLHENGCVLMYHNHDGEFVRVGGKTILQHFYDETDPKYLQGELDTYWVQFGGGDPIDWCRRLHNRLPVIHLKDYQASAQHKPTYCEIGQGNLNFHGIIEASEISGCEWFVVEQDTTPGDPFDSLRISFDYLRENFA